MPDTIKLHLMENRSIRAEFNNSPYAYEGGLNIVAGELNATQFEIASVPARLQGASISLEMINSMKENVEPPEIKNNIFILPAGMAVVGYGQFVITLQKDNETVVFLPFKIKVANTRADWQSGIIQAVPITIGTTTTLPPGSAATVKNVGTQLNPVLNFGIPKGDTPDLAEINTSIENIENKISNFATVEDINSLFNEEKN